MKSQLYRYNQDKQDVKKKFDLSILESITSIDSMVHWINFHGFDNSELLEGTFNKFGVHRVTKKDIVDLDQRPKVEEFDEYLYITIRSLYKRNKKLVSEQMSFLLKDNLLLSIQEKEGDIFNAVRFRIVNNTGIVRKKGSDYLMYLLLDAVIAGYKEVLKTLQSEVDKLQEEITKEFSNTLNYTIDSTKGELRFLRKEILPLRDQLNRLIQSPNRFLLKKNTPYFADLRDQVNYIMDEIEQEKSELEALSNQFFAQLSIQSNNVMQFLTVIAAIFIPLTFIAGLYGMNFVNMPELQSENGYYVVLGIMCAIAGALIYYFWKKKWL
jgi:magnesium transporter